MIWNFVCYCPRDKGAGTQKGKDLGYTYTEYFNLVPPGDWGLVIDHDALFLISDWYRYVEAAVEKVPDAGMFVARTNRLVKALNSWQMAGDDQCHDIRPLRRFAANWAKEKGETLTEVTTDAQRGSQAPSAGIFQCIRKEVWDEIKEGVPHSHKLVDWWIHRAIAARGYKIFLIEAIVMYHWYRGRPL